MDTLSVVATNALEGVLGGVSSILPILSVSIIRGLFYSNADNITVVSQRRQNIILACAIIGSITGGVLADNYIDSIFNGAQYGTLIFTVLSYIDFRPMVI